MINTAEKIVPVHEPEGAKVDSAQKGKLVARTDIVIVFGMLFYAAVSWIGLWSDVDEYIFLGSDIAASSAMPAAQLYPERFEKDAVFYDLEKVQFYFVLQNQLIKLGYSLFGNIGDAVSMWVAPHMFLQLLGFYVLGRVLFKSRLWALSLSLLTAQYIHFNFGDFWGLYPSLIPRVTFQTALPFLLAAVYHWRDRPKLAPLFMFVAGLFFYLHPVSAPGVGFAIWSGYWFLLPRFSSAAKKVGFMFLIGCCFLVGAAPFIANYLIYHEHGATLDYETIIKIYEFRFLKGFLDQPAGIWHFFDYYMLPNYWYASGIIAGVFLAFKNKIARTILGSIAGLYLVSIVVPLIDHWVAEYREQIPVQIDLVRNLRYSIPLSQILLLMGLFSLSRLPFLRNPALVASFVLCFLPLSTHEMSPDPAKRTLEAWAEGKALPELERKYKLDVEHIKLIRESVPLGASVFVSHGVDPLIVRAQLMLPVVYAYKDGAAFAYGNHDKLIDWYETSLEYKRIFKGSSDPLYEFYLMAKDHGAEYLITGFDMKGGKLIKSKAHAYMEQVAGMREVLAPGKFKAVTIFKLLPEQQSSLP